MKTAASIVLIILIVPLFLVGLVAATVRFQFLNHSFWQNTFEKYDVYSNLANVLKKSFEDQVIKEGGRPSDVTVLTDLVTPENIKDFVDKNIINILNFANARTSEFLVYIPINKIPRGLLPAGFTLLKNELPVSELLSKFNIKGINQNQIQNLSLIGRGSAFLLILDTGLFVLFTVFLFMLVKAGGRFVAPGVSFIINGVLAVGLYQVGTQIREAMARDLVQRNTLAEVLLGTVAPPVLEEVLKIWLLAGAILIICGVVLLFLKKR